MPQMAANLSQMTDLMQKMVANIPQKKASSRRIASTFNIVLNSANKAVQSLVQQPIKRMEDEVPGDEVTELKIQKVQPNSESEELIQLKNPISQSLQKQLVQQTQKKSQDTKIINFPQCISVVFFEEKTIIVDFGEFVKKLGKNYPDFNEFKGCISQWTGVLYNEITQKSFSGYFSQYLNHDETKVYFTKSLILNFIRTVQFIENNFKYIWKNNSIELIGHFQKQSAQILEYTALKYPQQQKMYVSSEVSQAIIAMDNSIDPEFDYFQFGKKSSHQDSEKFSLYRGKLGQFQSLREIKMFINRLIDLTDKNRENWKILMKEIFTIDGKVLWNQIGAKLKENTPKYSQKQINQAGIKIKAPEVLRIIVKWVQELQKRYIGLTDGTLIRNRFPKKHSTPTVLSFRETYNPSDWSKRAEKQIQEDQEKMHRNIRSVIRLFPEFTRKYSHLFSYLDPDDMKSGFLSHLLSSTASQLAINYLLSLIQKIRLFELNLSSLPNQSSFQYNFVSFKISDLLRCKCVGTLEQIKKVYEKLSKNKQTIQIYRVKNRIDTSNKDFLVNVKLKKQKMLCQIQLKVFQKQNDQKQGFVSHFSHLLYELSRAKYGPIGEAVMINTHLTEFVPFFKQRIPKIDRSNKNLVNFKVNFIQSGFEVEKYEQKRNNTYFICANCIRFRQAYSGFLSNFEQKIVSNSYQIQNDLCGECVLSLAKIEDKNEYLRNRLNKFSESFTLLPEDEFDDQKFIMPYLIYFMQKTATTKNVWIAHNAFSKKDSGSSKYSFVPIFWQLGCDRDKIISHLNKKQIKAEYYLFKLKNNVKLISVNRNQLIKICEESQSNFISGHDTELQSEIFPNHQSFGQPFELIKILQVKFQPDLDKLKMIQSQKVIILYDPQVPSLKLLNNVPTESEVQKFLNRKEFSKSVVESLKTATHWQLSSWDIDEQVLDVFKQYNLAVTRMDLNINKFSNLPQLRANELRKLILQNNKVQILKLSKNLFPKLQVLDLKNNRIRQVISINHDSIQTLELSGNRIQQINFYEWKAPNLSLLDLRNNRIRQLDLKYIDGGIIVMFTNNPLQKIELPNSIPYCQQLKIAQNLRVGINLSNVHFPNLKTLTVQLFQFEKIMEPFDSPLQNKNYILQFISITQHFPNVQKMTLIGCDMQEFNGNMFGKRKTKLLQLTLLNLKSIKFLDLSEPCFQNLKNIQVRQCSTLASVLLSQNLSELEEIKIQKTGLSEIKFPEELMNLQRLTLTHSQLQKIDFSNCGLHKLQQLDCSNNKLQSIIFSSGDSLDQILQIDISNNRLKELDLSQINTLSLSKLKQLDCSNNLLQKIKLDKPLNQLSQLNIENNKLSQLDFKTQPFIKLKKFNCSYNFITKIKIREMKQFSQCYSFQVNNNLFNDQLRTQLKKIEFIAKLHVQTGLIGNQETAIWLLSQFSPEEFTSVSEELLKQIHIPVFSQKGQKIQFTEEVNQSKQSSTIVLKILEIMRKMGKVNKAIEQDVDQMIAEIKKQTETQISKTLFKQDKYLKRNKESSRLSQEQPDQ